MDALHPAHAAASDPAHLAGLHWALARATQAVYLPDPALVQAAAAHAAGDAGALVEAEVYMARDSVLRGLVVVGDAGAGRASLLARTACAHRAGFPEDTVVVHFAGAGADARDPIGLMRRWTHALSGEEPPAVLGCAARDPELAAVRLARAMEAAHRRQVPPPCRVEEAGGGGGAWMREGVSLAMAEG